MGREANRPSDVKTVQPWGGGGGADSSVEQNRHSRDRPMHVQSEMSVHSGKERHFSTNK